MLVWFWFLSAVLWSRSSRSSASIKSYPALIYCLRVCPRSFVRLVPSVCSLSNLSIKVALWSIAALSYLSILWVEVRIWFAFTSAITWLVCCLMLYSSSFLCFLVTLSRPLIMVCWWFSTLWSIVDLFPSMFFSCSTLGREDCGTSSSGLSTRL